MQPLSKKNQHKWNEKQCEREETRKPDKTNQKTCRETTTYIINKKAKTNTLTNQATQVSKKVTHIILINYASHIYNQNCEQEGLIVAHEIHNWHGTGIRTRTSPRWDEQKNDLRTHTHKSPRWTDRLIDGSCHGKRHEFQQELEEWINMLVMTTLFCCIVLFNSVQPSM